MINAPAAKVLSKGLILGYGCGDFGLNLFYTGLNLYLLYYYTDVVELSPSAAGAIFMVSLLWDAITDPFMGAVATRTRTRFGRYRPYLLFGGPVLGISFVAMFAAPLFWPEQVLLASLLSHLFFRTTYTLVGVPYSSLSAGITGDAGERTLLAGSRMQFATLGAIATAFLTPLLAERLGGGDLKRGYMLTAVCYAVVAEIVLLLTAYSVVENPTLGSGDRDNTTRLSLNDTFKFLRCNKAFWYLFGAVCTNAIAYTFFSKAIVYYASYYLGEPGAVQTALTVFTLFAAGTIVFWTAVAKRFSKQPILFTGLCLTLVGYLTLFILAPTTTLVFYIAVGFNGFATAATIVMFWAMLPDTVEYGQWKSAIRDESIVFGFHQFALKAASGFGVGALGLILDAIGYVANSNQSEATLAGLRIISFLLPAVMVTVAILLIWRYPLTQSDHRRIVNELYGGEV